MTRTNDCISVKRFLLLDPIQNTMRTHRPSKTKKTVGNTLIAKMSIERRGKTIFKLTKEKEKKKKKKTIRLKEIDGARTRSKMVGYVSSDYRVAEKYSTSTCYRKIREENSGHRSGLNFSFFARNSRN